MCPHTHTPQLKREMQLAVEQERYKDAAALRDKVKQARKAAPPACRAGRVAAIPSRPLIRS